MRSSKLIRESVLLKKPIKIGHHGFEYLICVHQIMMHQSREYVMAYQIHERRGDHHLGEWVQFKMDDITAIEIINQPWATGYRHTRPDNPTMKTMLEVFIDDEGHPALVKAA